MGQIHQHPGRLIVSIAVTRQLHKGDADAHDEDVGERTGETRKQVVALRVLEVVEIDRDWSTPPERKQNDRQRPQRREVAKRVKADAPIPAGEVVPQQTRREGMGELVNAYRDHEPRKQEKCPAQVNHLDSFHLPSASAWAAYDASRPFNCSSMSRASCIHPIATRPKNCQ